MSSSSPVATSSSNIVEWLSSLSMDNHLSQSDILNGNTVHMILKKTVKEYKNELQNPLNTAVNKMTNWNLLIKFLDAQLHIKVSPEEKNEIIHGNETKVYDIMAKIKACIEKNIKSMEVEVDINKLDQRADPKHSKSLLELFILVIVKNLGLNAKESVALLSNDSKYLAHILAKGFKEEAGPVMRMLAEFQELLPQIHEFCLNKENELFFLKSVKPGLISKFEEVSVLSLQILEEFSLLAQGPFDIFRVHLIPTMVLQYRRHPQLLKTICGTVIRLSKYAKTMLVVLIHNTNPKEFLTFYSEVLEQTYESSSQKNVKALWSLNKTDEMLQTCIDSLNDSNCFMISMWLLLKLLEYNYEFVVGTGSPTDSKQLATVLHHLEHIPLHKPLQINVYINGMFRLLEVFGHRKNPIAPLFFKLCVEKFKITLNNEEATTYGQNFLNILKTFPSIPNTLIVDAIIERYENSKSLLTDLDIQILGKIVLGFEDGEPSSASETDSIKPITDQRNLSNIKEKKSSSRSISSRIKPKNEEKTLLKIYNILSKIFLEEVSNSQYIADILVEIISSDTAQQSESKAIQEINNKMVKVCLAVHYGNIRKLNMSKSIVEGVVKIDETNAFCKRKNLDIEYFLTKVVLFEDQEFNKYIEPLICYSFIQSDAKNKPESEGLKQILALLGDVPSLVKKYEEQVRLLHEEKRSHRKKHYEKPDEMEGSQFFELPTKEKFKSGENYSMYLSKISKIPADTQKGLEKYRKMHKDKLEKERLEEKRRLEEQEHKENLQKVYTKKILQKGIKVDPSVNTLHKYMYEFGVKEAELQKQKQYDFSSLHIFNPDEEEDNDLEALKYVMKRYNKVLRLYYNTYGGNLRPNAVSLFDEMAEKTHLMQVANIWKLFKDHFLDEFMTVKEAQYLAQKINAKRKNTYKDINLLDFEAFENFIIQASLTMFSRPPKDLSGHSISYMVEETFYRFKLYASENKFDMRLFEDEKERQKVAEGDEQLLALNSKLKETPEYILPEGFKKVTEKKVQFYHCIGLDSFKDSYSDVMDVLEEILEEKFGFNIVEPYSVVVTNTYAKPTMYKKVEESTEDVLQKYFSLKVKKTLADMSPDDRKTGREAAYIMMEVVDAIAIGKQLLGSKQRNNFIKQQEMDRLGEEQENKRREKRNLMLKEQLKKKRQLSEERKKQEVQKRKADQKKAEEDRKKRQKYEEDLKKKVQDYQKKREEDRKRQEQQLAKKKAKEQADFQKKRAYLQGQSKKIQEIKEKKKEEEQKLKKEQEAKEKARLTKSRAKLSNRSPVIAKKSTKKNQEKA